MRPILVVARLQGPITGAPFLDALLGFVESRRRGLVAGFGPMAPVEVPIAMEPGGRFYLASSPEVSWVQRERRYVNRRFPIAEAQCLAERRLRRIDVSAGACRSYRIPGDVAWAEGDAIRWWCVGDPSAIEDRLAEVRYLGKRRAVGRGVVARWDVTTCEPWGDGFPIVRDGSPTRPLPLDWPGLVEPSTAYHSLAPPYWDHTAEVLCAVPHAQC